MKKYLALVIAALAMGAAMMARADSEVVDGVTWQYRISSGEAIVTEGSAPCSGDMKVPDCLGGCPVVSIGWGAFSGENDIRTIRLPDTVRIIDYAAFWNCSSLQEVNMPTQLQEIGYHAFSCTSISECIMPDSVMKLGYSGSFQGCRKLTKLRLSASLSEIPDFSFADCTSIVLLDIPISIKRIGDIAFSGCTSLKTIELSSEIETLGRNVFSKCSSLSVIEVSKENKNYAGKNNCIVSRDGTSLIAVPLGCSTVTIPNGVIEIPAEMFSGDLILAKLSLPDSLQIIGQSSYSGCSSLTSVTIPERVTSIGNSAFYGCAKLANVQFLGAPPSGIENSYLLNGNSCNISYPREYGGAWVKVINDVNKFRGYNRKQPEVAVVSSKIRVSDPTILDVVYKVTSAVTNTVKVRALAFEDGVRSFAKVVRPETFVADTNGVETAGNVGDHVAANVEHTLSWKVSADWSNQLAKVSFEVLASEGDLLPLEVRTIPASDQYGKMDVTWNAIAESQWFDALLWLYADNDSGIVIEDGVVKRVSDGYLMTYDTVTISTLSGRSRQYVNGVRAYYNFASVPEYVLGKMGYTVLSGEVLNYVNEETRLGLSPSGTRQYGYKIVSSEK